MNLTVIAREACIQHLEYVKFCNGLGSISKRMWAEWDICVE